MEHEVFVPFSTEAVRQALSDPARVAGCLPGFQQDADEASGGPLAGRLRLRIGGSTITYRGTLRLAEHSGSYEITCEGTEARGSGEVSLTLTLTPVSAPGGTLLRCAGTVRSGGRLADIDPKTAETAARRLLDRWGDAFSAGLTEAAEAAGAAAGDGSGDSDGDAGAVPRKPKSSVFETEIPPPSLDAEAADDVDDADDVLEPNDPLGDDEDESIVASVAVPAPGEPPAEAAHARRTMIGRSAEEVDHAPPRGRYAPVPAPEALASTATLRWAAPAAAVVLASAVVVGRVLRRRK
ncbi:SRPBCC domain-containing protein [Streptomyces sp. NPDC050610]|uniref:SRPBCC domain-containing protein n=1 Tax=Streptomyces sp. NPDC050610 TaxID=3157097 RepID=UPI00343479D0